MSVHYVCRHTRHYILHIKRIYAFRMNVRLNCIRQLLLLMNLLRDFREVGCRFFKKYII